MYLREPIYLNGAASRRQRQWSPLRPIANLVFLALIVGVNYFVFFHEPEPEAAPAVMDQPSESESRPAKDSDPKKPSEIAPEKKPDAPAPEATSVARRFEGTLSRGDTLFAALLSEGLDNSQIAPVLGAMREVFDFKKARAGNQYSGTLDASGRIARFEYHTSPLDVYEVQLANDDYQAKRVEVPIERKTVVLGCTIGSSLFGSVARCGEGPELAAQIADVFAFDLDFFHEIRQGDVVKVVVDKLFVNGRFLQYEALKAATYEGKFGTYSAFAFAKASKDGDALASAYYTQPGQSLEREFLKTPLKYTRISSGYTMNRFHPTLHKWKRHLAIDYAAPVNTPVQAVASGKITFVGNKGASGNLVVIEHDDGTSSYYAHLNKFGKVQEGDRVTQKTVIGFVGQTGRATGPHLHFALKHKGKWVNPLEVKSVTPAALTGADKARFQETIAPLVEQLKKVRVQSVTERQG